jgi:hypothetical protein
MKRTSGLRKLMRGKHSKETKEKIRRKLLGRVFTPAHRDKIGKAHLGKKRTDSMRKKMSAWQIGRKLPIETLVKMSLARKKRTGDKSPFWKGGVTPEHKRIRKSIEYKLWQDSVFARDGYTCQKYLIVGGRLVAHHILNFSSHPELRVSIDNGVTLSEKAHKEFHKKYGFKNNTREQIIEFIQYD